MESHLAETKQVGFVRLGPHMHSLLEAETRKAMKGTGFTNELMSY